MATLVSAPWVEAHLDDRGVLLLDPRRPMRYLQGHLKGAVNLPISKAFDAEGQLLPDAELQRWLGSAGVDESRLPVVYDAYDGQSGALLAWLLEYFGRAEVRVLDIFYERWAAEGRPIGHRPVAPTPATFRARPNPAVRATLADIQGGAGLKLIDFRSREEYAGEIDRDGRPGHIPGAVNIVWRDLLGPEQRVIAPPEKIEQLLSAAGIRRGDAIVGYCRAGLRAAVGYLALRQAGYAMRLYDRSYAEWARRGLPVEV
jgi:thiosulfate/3-mercaptopyruvate sulfurtransferase